MIGRLLMGTLLAGCAGGADKDAPALLDTGWFDSDVPSACTARLDSTTPASGASGWYWRSAPEVLVTEAGGTYGVRLHEASGPEVVTTVVPNDSGLRLAVTFEGGLRPNTDYVLEVTDCEGVHESTFRTSALGLPLTDAAALDGRTWQLDVTDTDADWVQPAGLGALFGSFFDQPVLVGVQWVQGERIDLIGGLGTNVVGAIVQDLGLPTWNFPVADFAGTPFFSVDADEITLVVSGYDLPIYNFHLEGTFLPDASAIGGAVLIGLGDTRYAGGAVGFPGRDDALCQFGAGVGVPCEPCPDGEPLCLQVEIHDIPAPWVQGLSLEPSRGDVP